jgi:diguanylate cyclase (GGDEF)-like protein
VARIGGDEFAVLLTQVEQSASVHTVAKKLLAAVADPYRIEGREARISASIGIAMHPTQGESLKQLLQLADASMYTAKTEGKNTYRAADARLVGGTA